MKNKIATPHTLRELFNTVPNTVGVIIPTFNSLRNSNAAILYDSGINSPRLVVYDNGYFTYSVNNHTTVQSIHKCKESIWYEYADGQREMCDVSVFWDEPFQIRLTLEGEMRLETNQNVRHCAHQYTYDNMSDESSDLACHHDFVNDILDSMDKVALYKAISNLTDKQRVVVEMCFLNNMTQKEAACRLGISREAVKARLESALRALRRNGHVKKSEYI